MMSDFDLAMAHPCPFCGAARYEQCVNAKNTAWRHKVHKARVTFQHGWWEGYREGHKDGVQDTKDEMEDAQ